MNELMRHNDTKDDARAYFDELWEAKDMAANERRQMQQSLLQNMIWNPEVEFYPYFASYVMDSISLPVTQTNASARARQQAQSLAFGYQDSIHRVNNWSDQEGKSMSGSFVDLAKKANKLEEVQGQVAETVAKHLESEEAKRDQGRYTSARILEALIHFQQEQPEEGLKIIAELREDKKTAEFFKQSQCEMTLGQILEKLDDPRAVALAIELFEAQLKDRQNMGSFVT
jgi:hypothetical protein